MDNQTILNERWNEIDKLLAVYLKNYNRVNKKTQDNIQSVFDMLKVDYSNINKQISRVDKQRLDRIILEWQEKGILSGYFGYNAQNILARKNLTYSEMLYILIQGQYMVQYYELGKANEELFYRVCELSYNNALFDLQRLYKKEFKPFREPIYYMLINIPLLEATATAYLYSLSMTNAEDLYKSTLSIMKAGKELNVNSNLFKNIIRKHNNRFISINDDKISGAIPNITGILANRSYLQAGVDNGADKVRFIAVIDSRTTKMCKSLNNQIFFIDKMNVYQRYSNYDKRYVTYHTKGLMLGKNLPPIDNHFHYCRSTITYLTDMSREDIDKIMKK